MSGKYDDIIDLPHHVSSRHPHMPLIDRAAQFSPFAALSGHADAIDETARLTDQFVEMSEDQAAVLDVKLQAVQALDHPEIAVSYFEPDTRKQGGAYLTVKGRLEKIDEYQRTIVLDGGISVPIDRMKDISIIEAEHY